VATLQLRSTVNEVERKTFRDVGILICAATNEQRILKFVYQYGGPNWSDLCFILELNSKTLCECPEEYNFAVFYEAVCTCR